LGVKLLALTGFLVYFASIEFLKTLKYFNDVLNFEMCIGTVNREC